MLEKPNAKKALLDVIKDTSAYKDIEEYLKYIKYLKDDKELLAKAFEQYIIDYKSSNKRHKKCDTDKKSKKFLQY